MSWYNCLVGSIIVVFAAGCAVAPEAANVPRTGAEPTAALAPDAAPEAASEAGVARDSLVQPTIVDLQHLAQGNTGVICREMLKPLSNVIVTYCGTPDAWKVYKRQQEQWAQQMLRMMQGSPYR
jgi:hypothetical protein